MVKSSSQPAAQLASQLCQDQRPVAQLLHDFKGTQQQPDESLKSFGSRLCNAFAALRKGQRAAGWNPADNASRQRHFAANVISAPLHHYLMGILQREPHISFVALRDQAIHWSAPSAPGPSPPATVQSATATTGSRDTSSSRPGSAKKKRQRRRRPRRHRRRSSKASTEANQQPTSGCGVSLHPKSNDAPHCGRASSPGIVRQSPIKPAETVEESGDDVIARSSRYLCTRRDVTVPRGLPKGEVNVKQQGHPVRQPQTSNRPRRSVQRPRPYLD